MKQFYLAMVFAVLILSACGDNDNSASKKDLDLPDWNHALSKTAQLIDKVPEDAAFYLRIPSVWGLFFSPKGNSLHNALASEANQEQLALFQQQLLVQLDTVDLDISVPLKALLYHLRSPIELVLLLPQGSAVTSSQLVVSGQFNFENLQQLNKLITQQSSNNPMINFSREATLETPGLINIGPTKLYYSYNTDTQTFTAITGMVVFDDDLKKVLQWTDRKNSPIKFLEEQIDNSGQGLFAWLDFQKVKPLIEPNIPPSELLGLTESGLLQTEYFAFGAGSSNGLGNLSIIASGNKGLIWESAFNLKPLPAIRTAGVPDFVVGFQLGDKNWLNTFIRELSELETNSTNKESMISEWIKANAEFKQDYGVTIDDVVHAFSGQWLTLSDQAGQYTILAPSNESALDDLLNILETQHSIQKRVFKMGKTSITEISFNGMGTELFPPFISRLKSRIYLQKKKNHILIAEVPQVFAALNNLNADYSLNNWLQENSLAPEKHLIWGASNVKHIPRDNYYAYLSYVQLVLGDLLDNPVSIEKFPTANNLQLPDAGTQGMAITYGKGQIGISLIYDSHPGEYLMGGNTMTTVAIIGILAAIAVPAYQDYIKRAEAASQYHG